MESEAYEIKSKQLLNDLEDLSRKIFTVKDKIEKVKKINESEEIETLTLGEKNETIDKNQLESEESENSFEDEVKFYINNYHSLSDNLDEQNLKALLPKKTNKNYRAILLRLLLESVKEMKGIRDLLKIDGISKEEKDLCLSLLEKENVKSNYIKSRLGSKSTIEDDTLEENNLILVTKFKPEESENNEDNITKTSKVIEELVKDVPKEYYPGFSKLLYSIIDGTFKNVKMLNLNINGGGIAEVKGVQTRVVFTRVSKNNYAIITAFVKKSDNDKLYRDTLMNKMKDFLAIQNDLIAQLQNPKFIVQNEKALEQLWTILPTKEEKKGGNQR